MLAVAAVMVLTEVTSLLSMLRSPLKLVAAMVVAVRAPMFSASFPPKSRSAVKPVVTLRVLVVRWLATMVWLLASRSESRNWMFACVAVGDVTHARGVTQEGTQIHTE